MDRNDESYLRQNALIEPLFNQWYAWSHLISPATAAMFIANSHLKIMQSFVSSPQVHIAAMKNPAMLGGPFISYDAKRAGEIKALLEKTASEQADLLALAQAIKTLDELLINEADGHSLEPTYQKVPEPLKGYVELVYDLNNQPAIRFIEGLLYKSPYYKTSAQSLVLSLINGDDRSFVFSTPRLEDDSRYFLRIPFNHEGLDELMRMKSSPRPQGRIREMLGVAQDDERFSPFFTSEPPPRRPLGDPRGVRVSYFGHACLLIETERTAILTDPVISYKYDSEVPRLTHADLPEVLDYVLVTHNHQDHFALETLLQLRHKTRHIVVPKNSGGRLADPSLKMVLQKIGFKNVIELDEVESIECEDGHITGLPFLGEHADLDIKSKMAYLVRVGGRSVLIAADSNNLEPRLYDHIRDLANDLDAVFLGMECDGAPLTWIYGPLLTRPLTRKMDQSRRFDGSNYEKAIEIVKRLDPKHVYVYAMGQEPWLTYLVAVKYTDQSHPIVESNKLVADCKSRGITSERLFGRKEILL